ncbi:MAG: VOC family protein [Myxococcota bacterium]
MSERRLFFNLIVDDVEQASRFYVDVLGFRAVFTSDWFLQLQSPDEATLELGLLRRDHESVPEPARAAPVGGMVTIVVEDVDAVHQRAAEAGYTVLAPPQDMFYGQRRMLVDDGNGLVVDLSSACPPDPDWMKRVRPAEGGGYIES